MANPSPPGDGHSSDDSARPDLSLVPCGADRDDDTEAQGCTPCDHEERERAIEASVRRHPANRVRAVPTSVDVDADTDGDVVDDADDDADQAEAERLADVIPLSDAYRPGEPF